VNNLPRLRGRSGLTYNSVGSVQLLLIGTNSVERSTLGTEKPWHHQTAF